MNDTIEETEEQRTARILSWRAQAALRDAPALMMHMRELIPTPERGETDPHLWSPMRLNPTDDSDAFYAGIINWVTAWAEYLHEAPPATPAVAWSNDREAQGFRAGTTPEGALLLTRRQTGWLLAHDVQIERHDYAGTFHTDVVESIGALRGRYPLAPGRPRPVSLRPCPLCGEHQVGADWMGYELTYVEIRCEHCGWTASKPTGKEGEVVAPKPSEILRWLSTFVDPPHPISEECEAGEHAATSPVGPGCRSLTCTCWCHDWAAAEVGHGQETPVRTTGRVPRLPASTATPDPRVCPICHLYHPNGACQ